MDGDTDHVKNDTTPYGVFLDSLRLRKVIPFLGAAASRVGYTAGNTGFLPSGMELAEILATAGGFPWKEKKDLTDLAMVSSYYVDVSPDRDILRSKLRSIFSADAYKCNALHQLLAKVADGIMIVTTNYDTLIEQAFRDAKKPYDLYAYPADNAEYKNALLWWQHGRSEPEKLKPNDLDVEQLEGRNVIYKIHGSVRAESEKWDGFVITEEDYIDFLSRMNSRTNTAVPPAFKTYFSERSFLFLGYGLKDWNLRVLLKQIGLKKRSSAILYSPSEIEEKMWFKRNVQIYNLTLEEFVAGMENEINKTTPKADAALNT
jgi:hypothetical protein